MCQKPPLFAGHNWLQDHIRKNSSAMRAEIDGMADEELLNVNILERARQLAEKYRMRSVTLGDPVIADHGQKRLEARGVVSFAVYAIPFEGDPELFRRRVNWMNKMPPVGEMWEAERELRVEVNSLVGGAKEMKAAFERTKKEIEEHVKAVTEQVESHNRWLADGARDQMLARRTKVRNHVKLVEELGLPIRPAAPAPATYAVTLPRK
jgi:hypothetical protein